MFLFLSSVFLAKFYMVGISHKGEKIVRCSSFTSIVDEDNDGKADYVQTAFGTRMGFINYVRPANEIDQQRFDNQK
ncbi:MAG: hypothetical protein KBD14_02300 [Candidatus Pacebacteria bacterium]|nr:hypothetical protein [Candidatus Paceibacterota bacterium]